MLPGLELSTPSPGLRAEVGEHIRAWQGDVLALVGEQASGKRGTARALSLGVNGLGLTLMIVVFASTGGLTGAEFGIAGGTAVLAQRVLEGVFGDDAVRRLTRTAHEQLGARVRALLAGEAGRFYALLDAQDISARAAGELEAAADDVEAAARVERLSRAQYAVPGGTRGTGATTAGTTRTSEVKRVGASGIGGLRGVDVPTPLGWLTPAEDRSDPGESAAGDDLESDTHARAEAGEGSGPQDPTRSGRGLWQRLFGRARRQDADSGIVNEPGTRDEPGTRGEPGPLGEPGITGEARTLGDPGARTEPDA